VKKEGATMVAEPKPWEQVDIFSGPAVVAAAKVAASVPPGQLVRTAFSAYDTGDLIDLEGASFIAKLPEAAPRNSRIYWGRQWFIQGKPVHGIDYRPRWADFYVEETRCWLLDVAALKNWFAENPSQDVLGLFRHKSLDPVRHPFWGREAIRLTVPQQYKLCPEDGLTFNFAVRDQGLSIGEDLPLAVWYLVHPGVNSRDVMAVAGSSPLACVWFVRFQEQFPGAVT
jgi:hypothetical protein